MPKLNDTQCRNAKPVTNADGTVRPTRLVDGNGLALEVKAKGTGVWRYRFELGGKPGIYTLGNYPAISLSDARKERERLRELVKQGINPVHDRRIVRAKRIQQGAMTFEAVADEWLGAKDWQDDTKARRRDMFKRVVFPTLGKLPVSAITAAIVLEVLKKAHTANGPSVAAEAKRSISGVFELAVATLRADSDPTYPIRKALPKNKTQHKRPLTNDEIGRFMRDLDGYEANFQTVNAFRLMWLTLCRPSEAIEAEWSEFDLDASLWRIPAARMKKRRDHTVPLPRQAVEMLRAMYGVTGKGRFAFPHRDDRNRPMTAATLRQALKTLGWAGEYSPHATRTTGSTRLNEMNYSADWIERQLAHAESNNVRRTYNHAEYLEGRTKMMQGWADTLDALRDGAKIIPGKFGYAA
ncbi:tyrosine-type recombinase/integrase [Paraburkholderia xenovorans]|uniref:tyrosine-type recombinase/integrase n=1 Tax=Paraburkholderia xenovorans TaxID=36873 RepID=UPI0015584E56|nr:tyrosine-type recombinase/integrase [Paraburkholderia xenovorans]NPT36311.1 tyrosine-type recombinase/integrase [Paraburkholderia xenovorans]